MILTDYLGELGELGAVHCNKCCVKTIFVYWAFFFNLSKLFSCPAKRCIHWKKEKYTLKVHSRPLNTFFNHLLLYAHYDVLFKSDCHFFLCAFHKPVYKNSKMNEKKNTQTTVLTRISV
jgi:hypothetical protein